MDQAVTMMLRTENGMQQGATALYATSGIVRVMKSRRLLCVEHVVDCSIRQTRNLYRIFVDNL